MTLAAVATNQEERRARRAILAQYPNTMKGQLQGLAHFTKQYVPALKEGKGLSHIERNDAKVNNSTNGKKPEDVSCEKTFISA